MDLVYYQLELFRSSDGHFRKETVSIPSAVVSDTQPTTTIDSSTSRPSTVADLKEVIQDSFNIPMPIQKLSYNGQGLEDSVPLKEMYLREGDIIRVCYNHEGDCKEIIETVQWLKKLDSSLKLEGTFPLKAEIRDYMYRGLQKRVLTNLPEKYFYPWFDSQSYVNKLYFIALSGFDVLVSILDVILGEPWDNIDPYSQTTVKTALFSLWHMGESVDIKKMFLGHDYFLDLCLKCFTLSKVENHIGNQPSCVRPVIPRVTKPVMDVVFNAQGLLCM